MQNGARKSSRLEHDAFLYTSDEQFVTALVPFLGEGLARGEPAVAITTPDNLALLRDGLGADAAQVRYVDAADWYVRPAAAIADCVAVVRELTESGASAVRVIGEPQFGATAREWGLWTRYEAIVNRALGTLPMWVVCLYDTRTLHKQLIRDAYRTHAMVWQANDRQASPRYVEPGALLRQIPEPGLTVAGQPSVQLEIEGDPHVWRRPVAAAISSDSVPAERVEEFLIAISEVVANALRHGRGRARLALWPRATGAVCEVHNDGLGLDDPFAGYLPPDGDTAAWGMGLWIARQLSEALAIHSGPDGTTVRLGMGR
jgi:anti-sigma regulatory factor (Ser/Thr protein kinase)